MSEHQSLRPTVLVVDDYDELRSLTSRAVESFGYRVVEATNGQEAVEVARRELPQLILMDLSMPSLDGLATMQRIHKQAGLLSVPVVIISGHSSAEIRADAAASGCCEYLTKPVDFELLRSVLGRILPGAPPPSPAAGEEKGQ